MSDDQSIVEYREIPGFPGYRVGSDGTVWSTRLSRGRRWQKLRPNPLAKGHLFVCLRPGPTYRFVHRLVLEAFVGPCPPGMECCHSPDRDPANNRLENLRWDTPKANGQDKVLHGTHLAGEDSPSARLTNDQVRAIRAEYAAGGTTQAAVGAKYGITPSMVCNIVNRRTWRSLDSELNREADAAMETGKTRRGHLSPGDIVKIRSDYATGRFTQTELARKYKTTQANISCIVLRKVWTHVD